jgi:Cu(I)/Ag(I) efflux system protein CusF
MRFALAAAVSLAFIVPAIAHGGGAGSMSGMTNMQGMSGGAMMMASGEGVVTALNAKAGTVTIHHGPIAALKWPAMTMAFNANPPSLLKGIKVGQTVSFTLMQMGGSTSLTAIKAK